MSGPPVTGNPVLSPVLLLGQAPGAKEILVNRPFAWTAGKTLFSWFSQIGLTEEQFRNRVYIAAVCRCYPGKNPAGGDRVPRRDEIANCSRWLQDELRLLKPQLVLPAGKLAIQQFLAASRLDAVVGTQHRIDLGTCSLDVIPLPHPSGASPWHRTEPGKSLLLQALQLIEAHPAWAKISR
ncbi:MAG: uracil-DNA glycosylase family protein [Thiogranum sp.]|nr:uracil-DNA glycosylase family protein [Thiogranum sp.]